MHAPSKIRARHGSWRRDISSQPYFERSVTLDPVEASKVWERLSINTTALEFQELPLRIHKSLLKTLARAAWAKRARIGRKAHH